MSMISEQIESLRDMAEYECHVSENMLLADTLNSAADTIEMLSKSDSISRQAAIDEVKRLHDVAWANWKETKIPANMMIDALKNLPSADVPEIRVGEMKGADDEMR